MDEKLGPFSTPMSTPSQDGTRSACSSASRTLRSTLLQMFDWCQKIVDTSPPKLVPRRRTTSAAEVHRQHKDMIADVLAPMKPMPTKVSAIPSSIPPYLHSLNANARCQQKAPEAQKQYIASLQAASLHACDACALLQDKCVFVRDSREGTRKRDSEE